MSDTVADTAGIGDITEQLAPVWRTLARMAQAYGAPPPVLATASNGTVAFIPDPRATRYATSGFLAAERAAYARVALRDARWRAHQYTQRPRSPQLRARARKQAYANEHSR